MPSIFFISLIKWARDIWVDSQAPDDVVKALDLKLPEAPLIAETKTQLNLTFIPVEDRLLFRIATGKPGTVMEEYRLWLTRRLVKLLGNALDRMIELATTLDLRIQPESRHAVQHFQQNAALAETDFTTPYVAEQEVCTPMGPNPLLVHQFQARTGTKETQVLSLETTTGQSINISLNLQLIHSLRKLLADMIEQADWNIQTCSIVSEDSVLVKNAPRTIN